MIKRKKNKVGNVEAGVPEEPDAYLWPRSKNGIVQIPYVFHKKCKSI